MIQGDKGQGDLRGRGCDPGGQGAGGSKGERM